MYACAGGHKEVVSMLLGAGADVNVEDEVSIQHGAWCLCVMSMRCSHG